jgi:hypothetical protein
MVKVSGCRPTQVAQLGMGRRAETAHVHGAITGRTRLRSGATRSGRFRNVSCPTGKRGNRTLPTSTASAMSDPYGTFPRSREQRTPFSGCSPSGSVWSMKSSLTPLFMFRFRNEATILLRPHSFSRVFIIDCISSFVDCSERTRSS